MKKEKISKAVIRRLPRYYRHLDELHNKGVVRISSAALGVRMGVTASQIRQDLSCFGEFGQQGYGYNIVELREEIGRILGVDHLREIVIIGAGNLGRAILQNFDFAQGGFHLACAFDVSPDLIGTSIDGVPVRSMDDLPGFFAEQHPDVAVLTVPKSAAQASADLLIRSGIRGIWNFTNIELHIPSHIIVEDVHFADSLLTLSYQIAQSDEEK